MSHATSQSRSASTPLVKLLKVRTVSSVHRPGGTATTSSSAPMSMPAASGCAWVLMPCFAAAALAALSFWFKRLFRLVMVVGCGWMECMQGEPSNKHGQSPERGHRLAKGSATNDRLAGAATTLTNGVRGSA